MQKTISSKAPSAPPTKVGKKSGGGDFNRALAAQVKEMASNMEFIMKTFIEKSQNSSSTGLPIPVKSNVALEEVASQFPPPSATVTRPLAHNPVEDCSNRGGGSQELPMELDPTPLIIPLSSGFESTVVAPSLVAPSLVAPGLGQGPPGAGGPRLPTQVGTVAQGLGLRPSDTDGPFLPTTVGTVALGTPGVPFLPPMDGNVAPGLGQGLPGVGSPFVALSPPPSVGGCFVFPPGVGGRCPPPGVGGVEPICSPEQMTSSGLVAATVATRVDLQRNPRDQAILGQGPVTKAQLGFPAISNLEQPGNARELTARYIPQPNADTFPRETGQQALSNYATSGTALPLPVDALSRGTGNSQGPPSMATFVTPPPKRVTGSTSRPHKPARTLL